jgi:hypothetical protein
MEIRAQISMMSLTDRTTIGQIQDKAQEIFIACELIDFNCAKDGELGALWDELNYVVILLERLAERGSRNAKSRGMEGSSLSERDALPDVR